MKALILAAGVGRRLGACAATPKCLLRVAPDTTLLDLQLHSLQALGIREVVVAVGHGADRVQQHLRRYRELSCTAVLNPDYTTTNYIYTLHLCRHLLDDDLLLLHGDLVFEPALLESLLAHRGSGALVDRELCAASKDFVARIEDGRVREIGVGLPGPRHPVAPLYRLTAADMARWSEAISDLVTAGRVQCYAEDALNRILDGLRFEPVWFSDALCMEIDTISDLRRARRLLAEQRRSLPEAGAVPCG